MDHVDLIGASSVVACETVDVVDGQQVGPVPAPELALVHAAAAAAGVVAVAEKCC